MIMSQIGKVGKGMATTITVAAARKAVGGIGAARRRATFGAPIRRGTARDVHTVTVNVPPGDLKEGAAAREPLARFGDTVQIAVRPASKDRGTELSVRQVHPLGSLAGDQEPQAALRAALREVKALAEIGFVLSPDRPATTTPTPLNAPLREATAHGREGGRL